MHRRRHPPQRPWYQQSALLTPTPTPSQSVRPVAANSTSGPVRRPRSSARLTAVLANVTEDRPARRGPGREGGRTTRREASTTAPLTGAEGAGTGEGRRHHPGGGRPGRRHVLGPAFWAGSASSPATPYSTPLCCDLSAPWNPGPPIPNAYVGRTRPGLRDGQLVLQCWPIGPDLGARRARLRRQADTAAVASATAATRVPVGQPMAGAVVAAQRSWQAENRSPCVPICLTCVINSSR